MSINLDPIQKVATTNIRENGRSISAENHYKKGLEFYNKRRIEDAVFELQLAVEFDPNNVSAHLLLGAIYHNLIHQNFKYFEKAILEFNEILKIDPENEEAIAGLASGYFITEDYENAIFYFEKILALPKAEFSAMSKKDVHSTLGFSYYKLASKRSVLEDIEVYLVKASGHLKKVLELDPDDKTVKEILKKTEEMLDAIAKAKKDRIRKP